VRSVDYRDVPVRRRQINAGRFPVSATEWRECVAEAKTKPGEPGHPSVSTLDENGASHWYPVYIAPAARIRIPLEREAEFQAVAESLRSVCEWLECVQPQLGATSRGESEERIRIAREALEAAGVSP
jgi:hypothetical protein